MPKSRQEARARGWLFVLADGVGGLDMGEVAAAKAVQVITEGFAHAHENTSLPSLLPRLIQDANAAVHDECLTPGRRGRLMASTVVACALRHDQAYVAHAGDSRCYRVRESNAVSLTNDHTVADQQRRLGLISSAEAAESEARHVLARSLGPERFVTADTSAVQLRAGDILVLCSDGLHGAIDDRELGRLVSQPKNAEAIAGELVRLAVERDGSDNSTVVVVAVHSVEAMSMYRGRLYPRPVS